MTAATPFQIQNRDRTLLLGFFESRIMTASHIAAIYFNGSREAAKKRLQKLKAAGLVSERKRRVNEQAVLFLTRKGFSLLSEEGKLADFPRLSAASFEKRADVSALTIRHELEVMDVKAAFYSAVKTSETFRIAEFSTWPRLHEFKALRSGSTGAEVLVRPDGFIRIHEKETDGGVSEHTFFLEVDRSTETLDMLVNRGGCYLEYYQSGGFAVRNGAARSDYKQFPFRVLIVLKSAERRNNTAERLILGTPPIRTLVHLSTMEEVLTAPVGAIWIRPTDYREAMGYVVSSKHLRPTTKYRRHLERDISVEKAITKWPLLGVTDPV